MKKILFLSVAILSASLLTYNCNRKNTPERTTKTAKLISLEKNGITLTELYSPEQFADATLAQEFSTSVEDLDNNKITVNYTVDKYEFGKQSNTGGIKSCANSAKGQHVHCIIDNQPYLALYEPASTVSAKDDGQHLVLSFLSRSYHESIKNKNAYSLKSVITGKSRYTARYAAPDLESPMLFYSRPKGEYVGTETDAVLLDFYLVNCDLSPKGYKVKAEINGNEFILTKWCGYFMEGLPLGENTIKLSLIDSKGNVVESPYSVSERKITLKK